MNNFRQLEEILKNHFKKNKQAIILLGSRRIGKTTLVKKVFPKAFYINVDEKLVKDQLETYDSINYKKFIGENKTIIIDEAQSLVEPGRCVKLFYDQIPGLKIVVTGSSSLHIKNKTGESMAGRCFYYNMHPLTLGEYLLQKKIENSLDNSILEKILSNIQEKTIKTYDHKNIIKNLLIFGLYPELNNNIDKKEYLKNLAETAVFKDIIELNLINNKNKALELLRLLAYQIGNLVSYGELANRLNIDVKTVQRYIDIFEQSFVLFRLYPFSKNHRNELGKKPKIYFSDLGIRNALIDNYQSIDLRADSGAMFKNFIICEVRKLIDYQKSDWKINYWRLKSGSEVDLILTRNEEIIACEIKLNKGRVSRAFKNRYPKAKTHVLTLDNLL